MLKQWMSSEDSANGKLSETEGRSTCKCVLFLEIMGVFLLQDDMLGCPIVAMRVVLVSALFPPNTQILFHRFVEDHGTMAIVTIPWKFREGFTGPPVHREM